MCFCGSGLKYKKCHYNIQEDSIAAEIIKLYNKIDMKIENDIKDRELTRICKEGCNECCSDYFSITEGEFAIIIDYLIKKKGKEYVNEIIAKGLELAKNFAKLYPKYYEQLERNTTGYSAEENLRVTLENLPEKQGFKCIFLDYNGSCSVYSVRPFICRLHGVSYEDFEPDHRICTKIPSSKANMHNMTNISEFMNEVHGFEYLKSNKYNCVISRRKYPIFYFIKIYFENGQDLEKYLDFSIRKMLFNYPKEKFVNTLIDIYKIK